jgi:tol-pal system protein YbgF
MIHRLLTVAFFCGALLSFTAFGEAEVVNDSENFALLEEQQEAPQEAPLAHDDQYAYNNTKRNEQTFSGRDEPALARDDKQISRSVTLLDKVRGLQQEVQELRGQLEIQAHDLKLLQEQQLSFYKDLDMRLREGSVKNIAAASASGMPQNMPATVMPATTIPAKTAPAQPFATPINPVTLPVMAKGRVNPANEQVSYLAAYELVKKKQYDNALLAMQAFVTKYPQGGYTANAQYWLGELYMVKNDYANAMAHFTIVLQNFPSSSKCAPSLLKVGYALAAMGRNDEARDKLQEVIQKYPDTNAAQLATDKINTLKNQ